MIISIIYFLLALITIGIVAGSVLVVNYLRKSYEVNFINSYFYYIVLMCVFGIYGIWGQMFVKIVLNQQFITSTIIQIISQLIPYIGFPFLILAWFMFLRFCFEWVGGSISRTVTLAYFIFLIVFFIGLGWSLLNPSGLGYAISKIKIVYVLVGLDTVLILWGLSVLLFGLRSGGQKRSLVMEFYALLTTFMLLLQITSVIVFYFYPTSLPAFILMYFLSFAVPLIYFYNQIEKILNTYVGKSVTSSFESLMAKFGISRREREIIEQVCSGKSNQEIADTLFISLQTVKDHTHRIYLKMNIRNRVQLIKQVQEK